MMRFVVGLVLLLLIAPLARAVTGYQEVAITVNSAPTGTLTLTNGPPNIPMGASGSCTPSTCAWIQSGAASGQTVSDVYFDPSPMSSTAGVSFSLSGTNSGNYTVTPFSYTDWYGNTRNQAAHITTNTSVSGGDDTLTISAGGASQQFIVHKATGQTLGSCNENGLGNASSAAGSGGTILIPAGCNVSIGNSFNPVSNNQVFIGYGWSGSGSGGSTISGGGANPGFGISGSNEPSGDALMNVEVTGFTASYNNEAIQMGVNWVVRNIYAHDNAEGLSLKDCGNQVYNSRFMHNSYNGLQGYPSVSNCSSGQPQVIIGSEWAQNNTGGNDTCNDAGQKWISSHTFTLNLQNNYIHDNYEAGFWSDTEGGVNINLFQNTWIANGSGPVFEQTDSSASSIYQNFLSHNGDGTTTEVSGCGGAGLPQAQIQLHGASNVNVHDNNFIDGQGSYGIAGAYDWTSEGSVPQNNDLFHDNAVNFSQTSPATDGLLGTGNIVFTSGGTLNPSNTAVYHNFYHLIGGNTSSDQHWNYSSGVTNFSGWQGSGAICDGSGNCTKANPDTSTSGGAGTIDTSSAHQGTGCMHVACSSAGVTTGGEPN